MLSSCRRNKVKYLKVYQSFNFLGADIYSTNVYIGYKVMNLIGT